MVQGIRWNLEGGGTLLFFCVCYKGCWGAAMRAGICQNVPSGQHCCSACIFFLSLQLSLTGSWTLTRTKHSTDGRVVFLYWGCLFWASRGWTRLRGPWSKTCLVGPMVCDGLNVVGCRGGCTVAMFAIESESVLQVHHCKVPTTLNCSASQYFRVVLGAGLALFPRVV